MASATNLLAIISSANADLSFFLERASALPLNPGSPQALYGALGVQLPIIARAIEAAGSALASSSLPETPGEELGAQIEIYVRNLQRLKSLLPSLLAGAEARRAGLKAEARRINEALSWSGVLKLTALD